MSAPAGDHRVAVITGGSRGLGRALVERLLRNEWRVGTFSRSTNEFIAQMDDEFGDDFFWMAADLCDPAALRRFVGAVTERFGGVNLLVNNAATLRTGLLATTSTEYISAQIITNLIAPITMAKYCVRSMMSRGGGGQIVNISSINAIRGYRGVSVYAAAKAGLDGFSRSLARELGPLDIRVNSIVPGFFDSDMTIPVVDEDRDRILRRTPLGRLGTVDDVVEAVRFLTSPAGSFITGQTIVIDGGITC